MKKYLITLSVLGIFLIASTAFADNNGKKEKFEIPDVEETEMQSSSSLFIGPQGQVRIINGEVTSLGTATPFIDGVKVWGLTLQVNSTNAQYIPAGASRSDLKVGDRVNVKGTMSGDNGVVVAQKINLFTRVKFNLESLRQQIQDILQKIRELEQKLILLRRGA